VAEVFVSYRRADSPFPTAAVAAELDRVFGSDHVFRDANSLIAGRPWPQDLNEALAAASVMIVIIGSSWLDAPSADGLGRALDRADDWVRVEIATALDRGIPVIPVLVGHARRPHVDELPEVLRRLCSRQDLRVRDSDLPADLDRLINTVMHHVPTLRRLDVTSGAAPSPDVMTTVRADEALRTILVAERDASETHPYRIVGDVPRLGRVYVDQWAQPAPGTGVNTSDPERLPALQAVLGHRHVLLRGEAGQGKSSYTQLVARTFANAWLSDEAAPEALSPSAGFAVRVPAADLSGDAPVAVLLRASVQRRLGAALPAELPAELFARTAAGSPWLLLVDGLDEIVDSRARRRLVEAIASYAGGNGAPYRWVVTTRPLPDHELQPLLDSGLVQFDLLPFDDVQLKALAAQWIVDDSSHVDGFLAQLDNSGARQLVRVPLLAAIALVMYARDPRRPLPQGRPGLYREFVTYLP
jgi:hypothetical protein